MPPRGVERNPLGQRPDRFHRLRTFGGDVRSVDPVGETPTRFHERATAHAVVVGESPGTSEHDRSTGTLAAGLIRRLWRQLVQPVPPPPAFKVSAAPFSAQRTVRYLARSIYAPAGDQLSFARGGVRGLHTVIVQATRQPAPTLTAGVRVNPPTVRNRITSFGSRVEPLNARVRAAEGGQ